MCHWRPENRPDRTDPSGNVAAAARPGFSTAPMAVSDLAWARPTPLKTGAQFPGTIVIVMEDGTAGADSRDRRSQEFGLFSRIERHLMSIADRIEDLALLV